MSMQLSDFITRIDTKAINNAREQAAHSSSQRLFGVTEITRYIIPMTPAHFRKVIKTKPNLPQGIQHVENGNLWFTYDDIKKLKKHFTRKSKLPKQMSTVYTFCNSYRRSGKSSMLSSLAELAMLNNQKILILDLCSTGKTSENFGIRNFRLNKIKIIFENDYRNFLINQNKEKIARGETPVPLKDFSGRENLSEIMEPIRDTKYDGIHILPGGSFLNELDQSILTWSRNSPSWQYKDVFNRFFSIARLYEKYDYIFIDTGPNINFLTLAGMCAADHLIIPSNTTVKDTNETFNYINILKNVIEGIEDQQNALARAIGEPEEFIQWKSIKVALNKTDYISDLDSLYYAQKVFSGCLCKSTIPNLQEINNKNSNILTVLDFDPKSTDQQTYASFREQYNNLYSELMSHGS